MSQPSATSDLLRCPKNLRECIDWIVCIHGQTKTSDLAKALKSLGSSVELNNLDPIASELKSFLEGIKIKGGSQNYSSSYNGAKWPECGSKPCPGCQNSSPPCPCKSSVPSSQSCDGKCCDNCDVKKAAKIFLGFIPCLYYALKYLYEKCEGKGAWSSHNINNKDKSLHRFLRGMGYEIEKLEKKKASEILKLLESLFNGSKPLQSLYEKSKKYFTSFPSSHVPSPSDSPSPPKTVREVLLWLSGLPFTPGFKALLEHCERLCKPVENSVKFIDFDNFKASLFDSCFLSPFVLGAIEGSKSNEKGFPPYESEWQKFSYPEDPSDLLEKFCEYVRKIFVPLKFLCLQCERDNNDAGWKNCAFGQSCAVKFQRISSTSVSSFSSSGSCTSCSGSNTYLCSYVSGSNKDVHLEHCWEGDCIGSNSGTCSKHTSGQCKNPCPHPLLRFLIGSEDPQNFRTPFKPPESFPKMGFKNLPSPGRSGESLFGILDIFVGDSQSDKAHPVLRDLLRLLLCLTRTPPSTLGELYAFFFKLAEEWGKNGQKPKDAIEAFVSTEPGTFSGQDFVDHVQRVRNDEKNGEHKGNFHDTNDLMSLSACWQPASGKPCGPYLFSFIWDAYTVFLPELAGTYVSWICHLAEDFKKKLNEFKTAFESCSDCKTSGSSSGKCEKIVQCPCALPLFYSHGLTFMSPGNLNGKNCFDFISQLGKVLQADAPLDLLIKQIESFLWHIRLPFFLFILAFWAFVISYFLYVQLYKLDLLHLKSHAHLPRSFKILPSTLFSDASSKLKDLSYFSL